MIFRGKTYEAVIDIALLTYVEKKRLEAYASELKVAQLVRNKPRIDQINIEMNLQLKYIEELETLLDELTQTITKLALELRRTTDLVFIEKFINGSTDEVVKAKYSLTEERYELCIEEIDKLLNGSKYGTKLKTFLEAEE